MTTPTLQPDNVAALDPSAAAVFPLVRRRRSHVKKISKSACCCDDDDDIGSDQAEAEAEAEVEKKIVALQKIVPGGERLPVEDLFEETAEYIFALETQVKALRFLAAFVQRSQKRKRKLGG